MLEQFRRTKLDVIGALGELCSVGRAVGATSAAQRLDTDVVQKLEADRFHLVVVGEFNHGKTTFVNALLGRAVLPTGVTPTTAVIHHIVHAEEPVARVVYDGGRVEPIDFEQVRQFVAGAERALETVRYVEIGLPAKLLEERLVLVDTPGVNDLSLTRAEITYDYIPRSDAVLFVLDAGQPLKESEREFIEKQLIGKSRDKIVFIVAKADVWSEDERAEALSYIRARLGTILDAASVFPVSSQAALAGRREESGLPELLAHLETLLAEQRGAIVVGNALGDGLAAVSVLERALEARRRAVALSPEQLERRLELIRTDLAGRAGTLEKRRLMIREETAAIKAWARRDLDRFCDDVTNQLPGIVNAAAAEDLKQHLGAFLERSFREWAQAECGEIAGALEQLAERTLALLREDARDAGRQLSETADQDLRPTSLEIDTFAYDVGVFAVLSVGLGVVFANVLLGGVLLAAAPALALWNRDRATVEMRKRALEVAPVVLREAAAKMAPKIDQMIDEFSDRLDAWILSASQEVHRDVIEVLEDLQRGRQTTNYHSVEEEQRCDAQLAKAHELTARLSSLRSRLVRRDDAPVISEQRGVLAEGNGAPHS
jgi:ribosome biogenesis GTPase A